MIRPPPGPRGEIELIRRLRPLLDRPDSPVGFGDDMGVLECPGQPVLWAVDMLMDGVDFDSRVHEWAAIGRKAMAVNLSDCAAMGAQPVAALCAVALSNALTMDDAVALVRGAHEFGLRFGCPVVGGDTNSWDSPTVISVSIAACCEPGCQPVRRNGARPGDRLWLTGPVGGSLLGRHLTFEPRVAAGLEINRRLRPHAMIDISDGLALDLGRVLEASGCGAVLDEVNLDALIHPNATQMSGTDGRSPRDHALHDGEDFELIVALPPETRESECSALGLSPLGYVTGEPGLRIQAADGRLEAVEIRGWEHFR
ncbi:MAG: thiamine-phosphate kinase [Planctomycetota bacterium]